MIRYLFLLFAVICIIIGGVDIAGHDSIFGPAMLFAGLGLYLLYKAFGSPGVLSMVRELKDVYTYTTPSEIMEAASIVEQHKNGRELWRGGSVIITDDAIENDYSVYLSAQSLLSSSDPAMTVIDKRS